VLHLGGDHGPGGFRGEEQLKPLPASLVRGGLAQCLLLGGVLGAQLFQ